MTCYILSSRSDSGYDGNLYLGGGTLTAGTSGTATIDSVHVYAVTSGFPFYYSSVLDNEELDHCRMDVAGSLYVANDLTLTDTTVNLGDSAGTYGGRLAFGGTQTVGGEFGTIVLGGGGTFMDPDGSYYTDGLYSRSGTLTLGEFTTVTGHNGVVGGNASWPFYQAVNFVNRGSIWANTPGGTITIGDDGSTLYNTGFITASAGATIGLAGTLENSGQTLSLDGGGSFTMGGAINGGVVSGGPLSFGGTLNGVTVNNARLSMSGGTLNGVTLNTDMYLVDSRVAVTGGLTVNATIHAVDQSAAYQVTFSGTQTVDGSGSIFFRPELFP
jgi:hypothetical protein